MSFIYFCKDATFSLDGWLSAFLSDLSSCLNLTVLKAGFQIGFHY